MVLFLTFVWLCMLVESFHLCQYCLSCVLAVRLFTSMGILRVQGLFRSWVLQGWWVCWPHPRGVSAHDIWNGCSGHTKVYSARFCPQCLPKTFINIVWRRGPLFFFNGKHDSIDCIKNVYTVKPVCYRHFGILCDFHIHVLIAEIS